MIELRDQCRNKWASILQMFGIKGDHLTGRHAPCPLCDGGKDRFRFDNKDGLGTWICNSCGAGDGMKLLMLKTGRGFSDLARDIRQRLGEATEAPAPRKIDPEKARAAADTLWNQGSIISEGDGAFDYLTGRGLVGPFPMRLRFCRSCRVKDHPTKSTLPAMLALVSGPDGAAVTVHRTYLENGDKARWIEPGDTKEASPRKLMAGDIPKGSAIRLGEPIDGRLGIGEGIETALAVKQRFGITCWSAINSTMLADFAVPLGLRELHIFGDNDKKFGGQAAAYKLAHRAATMQRGPGIVVVHIPQRAGTDWADIVQRDGENGRGGTNGSRASRPLASPHQHDHYRRPAETPRPESEVQ